MANSATTFDLVLGNVFSELQSAICEQRWDDAATLLACFIHNPPSRLPYHCLWKVLDIVCRKADSIPDSASRQSWKYIAELGVDMEEIVLDSIPPGSEDTDNLLKVLDGMSTSSTASRPASERRVMAINEARVSYLMYQQWRKSLQNPSSGTKTESTGEDGGEKKGDDQARQIYIRIKQSLCQLKEPSEWLLLLYIHLECLVMGDEVAETTLSNHLEGNPCRPSALRLALHCYQTCLLKPVKAQLQIMKDLISLRPSDPIVLSYVDLQLTDCGLDKVVGDVGVKEGVRPMYDSGNEDDNFNSDDGSKCTAAPPCLLKSEDNVGVLLKCIAVVIRMLEHRQFVWKERPWKKLTTLLNILYTAWLRCWWCDVCQYSRKELRKLVRDVREVWRYLVWKPPPSTLTPDAAKVLIHHVFAAHVFCYSKQYLLMGKRALADNGLLDELNTLISPPGPHLRQFQMYANDKRAKSEAEGVLFGGLSSMWQ